MNGTQRPGGSDGQGQLVGKALVSRLSGSGFNRALAVAPDSTAWRFAGAYGTLPGPARPGELTVPSTLFRVPLDPGRESGNRRARPVARPRHGIGASSQANRHPYSAADGCGDDLDRQGNTRTRPADDDVRHPLRL